MRKIIFCGMWLIALSVALAWANSASAVINVISPTETTMTVADWAALGSNGFVQMDKKWVLLNTDGLPDDLNLDFKVFQLGGVDNHSLIFGRLFQGFYALNYSISVVQPSALQIVRATLGVDPDGSTGAWSVTKDIFSDSGFSNPVGLPLTVSNTSPVNAIDSFGGETTLFVHEIWSIDANSTAISTTNTYVQAIPEPTGIVIWAALGVVGLVVGWKHRKQR